MLPRLILIADRAAAAGRPLPIVVAHAAKGVEGRLIVQLREPGVADAVAIRFLRAIQRKVPAGTTLTVNNRPDVAQTLDLGLHLPAYAERPPGSFVMVGRSVHDQIEAETALAEHADYAIVGTIFPTASHPGRAGAGLDHLRILADALDPIPVFAIGGITADNAAECIAAGAWGVAVRQAIMAAADPGASARAILDVLPPWRDSGGQISQGA